MSTVVVNWQQPDLDISLWKVSRGLYAYLNLDEDEENEILYIGKVEGTTVRQRWCRSAKKGFWDTLESERQIFTHGIIVGLIELPLGYRLSRELIADIESLLINRLCPWGNIQCRESRISRPGLIVHCKGNWPLQQNVFIDG